jgi:hypothetical protein
VTTKGMALIIVRIIARGRNIIWIIYSLPEGYKGIYDPYNIPTPLVIVLHRWDK